MKVAAPSSVNINTTATSTKPRATKTANMLLTALSDAWTISDNLFNSLPPQHHLSTPITLRNPFIFYLGHLPAFTINTIRKVVPLNPVDEMYEQMFSRGRDPDIDDPAKCHDHPAAPPKWPSWEQVLSFRDKVRGEVKRLVEKDELNGAVVRMLVEHEIMHVETLYYMFSQMNDHPARMPSKTFRRLDTEWINVPAGITALGRKEGVDGFDTFAWDNEFHPGVVNVPEFQIMRHAVSIAAFKAFVDAGGYRNKEFWEPGDWEWISREGIKYPATWKILDGVLHVLTNTGPVDKSTSTSNMDVENWPVSVSIAEARAYARWIGAEIPTEAQWMRAAGNDEKTWSHTLAPAPVPVDLGNESWCGVVGMVGNGWELTHSVFDRFEGFVPTKLYQEYSQDFFDGKHYVLKGASWATHPVGVRPTFRNFYQARYPFVFSKFRLVRQNGRTQNANKGWSFSFPQTHSAAAEYCGGNGG